MIIEGPNNKKITTHFGSSNLKNKSKRLNMLISTIVDFNSVKKIDLDYKDRSILTMSDKTKKSI